MSERKGILEGMVWKELSEPSGVWVSASMSK